MIVGELSRQPLSLRQKFWTEILKLPVQWKEIEAERLEEPLQFLKNQEYQGLLVSPEFSAKLIPHSSRIPAEVMESGFADSLVLQNGKIWLRCFLREAMKLLILQKAPKLDTHSNCYLTGSDSLARLCAVVAIQLGFSRLVVISEDELEVAEFSENLKKLFFGLQINVLRDTELTLQPNNGSLLLNTLVKETSGGLLEDLTYLNFLKKDGLVLDLPFSIKSNSLLEEAEHVGVLFLAGAEIWGLRDYLFLQSLMSSALGFSSDEYLIRWKAFLSQENQT